MGSTARIRAIAAGVAAVLLTGLFATVGPTGGVGAAQQCDGPGDGSNTPVGVTPVDGQIDGVDAMDNVFVSLQGAEVETVVVLSNAFTVGISDPYVGSGTPAVAALLDVDKDGDDEILVSLGVAPQLQSYALYTLAGCDLVRLSDGAPGSPLFDLGATAFTTASIECLAPSAAGRGVTNYTTSTVSGTTFEFTRTEYALAVDDAAGTYSWTRTRNQELSDLSENDPRVVYARADEAAAGCIDVPTGACAGQAATIVGTPLDDVIVGTGDADVVAAGAGGDRIRTRGGDDLACGGGGADVFWLAAGDDTGVGQGGADRILGQGGDDTLNGGAGPDVLDGGRGSNDVARGGGGTDDCTAESTFLCE